MERGILEIAPLAFMRGRTLNDSFVILDEAQNTTSEQMKMFLTRLGFESKAVVTGDVTQIDLPDRRRSGLTEAEYLLKDVEGIAFCYFTEVDVVRHPLVAKIIRAYDAQAGRGRARPASRPATREVARQAPTWREPNQPARGKRRRGPATSATSCSPSRARSRRSATSSKLLDLDLAQEPADHRGRRRQRVRRRAGGREDRHRRPTPPAARVGARRGAAALGDGKGGKAVLHFMLSQNDSMAVDFQESRLKVDASSIAGQAVLAGRPINIPDFSALVGEGGGFTHNRSFDHETGYQTRSMLTVPMISAMGDVIGVIQLINKKRDPGSRLRGAADFAAQVVPFDQQRRGDGAGAGLAGRRLAGKRHPVRRDPAPVRELRRRLGHRHRGARSDDLGPLAPGGHAHRRPGREGGRHRRGPARAPCTSPATSFASSSTRACCTTSARSGCASRSWSRPRSSTTGSSRRWLRASATCASSSRSRRCGARSSCCDRAARTRTARSRPWTTFWPRAWTARRVLAPGGRRQRAHACWTGPPWRGWPSWRP